MTGWLFLGALAVAAAAAYWLSLVFHPWRPCRPCNGSGRARDPLFRSAFGTCPRCGGRGRKPRLGVRVFQRSRARRMLAARPSRKTADER